MKASLWGPRHPKGLSICNRHISNHVASTLNLVVFNSETTMTMFCHKNKAFEKTYRSVFSCTVKLSSSSSAVRCSGSGTLVTGTIEFRDSMPVNILNTSLASAGQFCDERARVVFTKKEAIILNFHKLTVNDLDIAAVVPRDNRSHVY